MLDYTNYNRRTPTLQQRGLETVFDKHYLNTAEGCDVIVDNKYMKKALIQKHSNPLNSHLEDKYFTILNKDREGLKWGSYVDAYEDKKYIVLTSPETTDGVTLKAKIRKVTGTCLFRLEDGLIFAYDCIDTNYLLYDDKTYTTDTKVFEEDERKAIVIPYTSKTSLLRVIDEVELNGVNYKILKKEFITEEVEGEVQGVVQLVLIRTTFGELLCNNKPLRGIVRFARMKDKVLNSKSRELITDHNQVKSGDYITHTYKRDSEGNIEKRYYIVRSLVDMHLEYDVTYIINCDSEFYMWNDTDKEPIMIPCYVEDNKTRFEDGDKNIVYMKDSQYQIIVQENEFTEKLGKEVNRIIIKGEAYRVVGTDRLSLENAIYIGLANSTIDPNEDNIELGIACFKKQCKDGIKPLPNIYIEGEEECIIGESDYEYNIIIDDDTLNGIWHFDVDVGDISYINGRQISLTIFNKPKNVGRIVPLTCEVNGIIYTKDIMIRRW